MRSLCDYTVILENKDHLSLDLLTFVYKQLEVDIPINTKGGNIKPNVFCVLEARQPHQIQLITEIMHSMVCIVAESSPVLLEEDVDLFNGICASINHGYAPVKEVHFLYHGTDFNAFMRSSPHSPLLDLKEINTAFAKIEFWAAPISQPDNLVLIKAIH